MRARSKSRSRSTTAARASGRPGPGDRARCFCNSCACSRASSSRAWSPASADALHLWLETAKLAFADRDACYGDPRFADVPIETLLSRDYAAQRRALVDPEKASLELRPGLGRLPAGWPLVAEDDAVLPVEPGALRARQRPRGARPTPRSVSRSTPRATRSRPRRAAAGS